MMGWDLMTNHNTTISPMQFFVIAVNSMFGSSLLTLPSDLARIAKEDMWMPMLFGSILIFVAFWVAVKLSAYFPDVTVIDYHVLLVGRIPGFILNVLMILLMMVIVGIFERNFTIAVKTYLLDLTPPQVINIFTLGLAIYAIQYGLAPLLRLQQFLFAPEYGAFLTIILLGVLSIDANNYQPMLAEGITPVLQGMIPTWFTYTGPEILIGFLFPFINPKKGVLKWGIFSISVTACIYVMITLIVQGILGPTETTNTIVPTMMAYRYIEIPDTFIERLDGYLMTIWIVISFTSLINWLYFIAFGIGQMLKLESSRPIVVLIIPFIYYLLYVPPNAYAIQIITQWVNFASLFWGLGITPLLLALAWLKAKRKMPC
ncbi:MAG: yndE2 [Firmicutes bacterium]|nr:yndE2 [Bacillota bacterium]